MVMPPLEKIQNSPLKEFGIVGIPDPDLRTNKITFRKLSEMTDELLKGKRIKPSPLIIQKLAEKLDFKDYKCIISLAEFEKKLEEAVKEAKQFSPDMLARSRLFGYSA